MKLDVPWKLQKYFCRVALTPLQTLRKKMTIYIEGLCLTIYQYVILAIDHNSSQPRDKENSDQSLSLSPGLAWSRRPGGEGGGQRAATEYSGGSLVCDEIALRIRRRLAEAVPRRLFAVRALEPTA